MSYRASLGAATVKTVAKLPPASIATVSRGWDPYRPWGRAYVYPRDSAIAGDNPFETTGTAGRMWFEHFLRPASDIGDDASPGRMQDGELVCTRTGNWSEMKYAAVDPSSLRFFKERRVLRLLQRLALPVGTFATGMDAALYDASFNRVILPNVKLTKAVVKALKTYEMKFPASRWQLVTDAVSVPWGTITCEYPSWRPVLPSGAPACEPIIAGQSLAVSSLPSNAFGRVEASELPLSAALVVGSTLIPTPWFSSLLTCLVPGWNR